jgi:hypothetical protein
MTHKWKKNTHTFIKKKKEWTTLKSNCWFPLTERFPPHNNYGNLKELILMPVCVYVRFLATINVLDMHVINYWFY